MSADLISLFFEPVIFATTLITVVLFLLYHVRNRGLPPGPIGLPYFGLLFTLKDENNHIQLNEMKAKYGDVFSFTVTGKLYISLGTVKLIREAHLSHSDCFERTTDYTMLTYVFKDGVGFVNGERWKVLRKFFTQAFREYGMATIKDTVGGPICDQVQKTMEEFRASNGEPIKIAQLLTEKCCTVMRGMLFGQDGISQKELLDLNNAYETVMKGMTVTKMLISGTIAKYLVFPFIPDCRDALSSHHYMAKILRDVVERHEKKFDENNVRDVIDSYLKERKNRQRRNDPSSQYFTNDALVSSMEQFAADGVSTTALFIGSFLISLVDHPEEQEKMYEEIAEVIGTDRLPSMDDKSLLPYTNAYIYEIIRTSEFFTMFPSLECIKETTIKGYRIPKGSMTVMNLWLAHHDPLVYEDPDKFDPSRFIPKPGKQRPELPVMFGIGKRSCAGEAFTMMQVFLFMTATIQNFKVSLPEGTKISPFFDPESLKFVVQPRHQK